MYANIYEPSLYALSYREETRQYQSEKRDEANTEEALSIMADWVQLHQYDNRHDFGDLPGRIILDWDQMGRPALPGHDEITSTVILTALENIDDGDIFAAESYMLCAAICEAMDSMFTSNVPETPAYEELFEAIKTVVEMEGASDDEWRY